MNKKLKLASNNLVNTLQTIVNSRLLKSKTQNLRKILFYNLNKINL